MKIVVSACLLGENCQYNGGNNLWPPVVAYAEGKEVIPVCPETLAGLGIPRTPIEIVDGIVRDKQGNSVDAALREAVEKILAQLDNQEIECVILKSRSPTCGVKQVYDGTFSGNKIPGQGLAVEYLRNAGFKVFGEEDIDQAAQLLQELEAF